MAASRSPDLETIYRWIRRAQARELGALEQLQREVYPRIRKTLQVAGAQVGEPPRSERACEEAFVSAVRAFDCFELRTPMEIFFWFFTTIRRDLAQTAPDFPTDAERPGVPPRFGTDEAHTLGLLSPDSALGPGRSVSTADAGGLIEECVAGLPASLRDVIVLRNYLELGWERIVEILELAGIDAARMVHVRGMVELSKRFREKGGELPGPGTAPFEDPP